MPEEKFETHLAGWREDILEGRGLVQPKTGPRFLPMRDSKPLVMPDYRCTKIVQIVPELSPNVPETTENTRTQLNAAKRYHALKSAAY